MGFKKLTILSIMLGLSVLSQGNISFAKIETGISQSHFYDTEKTIMNEVAPDASPRTEKFWSNNPFYFSKYRPLFMLANKELYDLTPLAERENVVQRVVPPSVYNVSLKSSSIISVSLASESDSNKQMPVIKDSRAHFNPIQNAASPAIAFVKPNFEERKYLFEYERAKNPDVDSDEKIEAANYLKESKSLSHHKMALDLLDDVTVKEPYNAYAFYLKGEIYAKDKSPQNAIKNYVAALRLNPTSKQCYLGIAKVLEPTNKSLAQKYYEKAALHEG